MGALRQAFGDDADLDEATPRVSRPTAKSCDSGYMTDRLRGVHIDDERFAVAFSEFTLASKNDRWPVDHPDEAARGKPKDGAFLVSTTGYRIKCAAKLLGLAPAGAWPNVGTKHETALSCAWLVQGSFVFVASDTGSRHLALRDGDILHVYRMCETP